MTAHEPGPALDALIAEKIDGWILPPYSRVVGQMWVEPPLGRVHPEGPRPYSTNDAPAFAALDAFTERHGCSYTVQRRLGIVVTDGNLFSCTIAHGKLVYPTAYTNIITKAKTRAHAICLALLRLAEYQSEAQR